MIYATSPISNAVLSKGSPTLLNLYFQITKAYKDDFQLKIELKDYQIEQLNPTDCQILYFGKNNWEKTICKVLPTLPNVIFALLKKDISNKGENRIQIELSNTNPFDNLSQAVSVYTVTRVHESQYIQIDQNKNFGQIPFTQQNTNRLLQINILNKQQIINSNTKGSKVQVDFSIEINQSVGILTSSARIKLVVTSPWRFIQQQCLVTSQDYNQVNQLQKLNKKEQFYKAPQISSFDVESPNQLSIVFSQGFEKETSFIVSVKDCILNPDQESQGYLSFYTMPFNSNDPAETNEKLVQFNVYLQQLTVNVLPWLLKPEQNIYYNPLGIKFFKGMKQYIRINVQTSIEIIKNSYIKLEFPPGAIVIEGTQFIVQTNSIIISYLATVDKIQQNVVLIKILDVKKQNKDEQLKQLEITTRIKISQYESYFYAKAYFSDNGDGTNFDFQGNSSIINVLQNYNSVIYRINQQLYSDGITLQVTNSFELKYELSLITTDLDENTIFDIYLPSSITSNGFTSSSCLYEVIDNSNITFEKFSYCEFFTDAFESKQINWIRFSKLPLQYIKDQGTAKYNLQLKFTNLSLQGASNHQNQIYDVFYKISNSKQSFNFMTNFLVNQIEKPNLDIKLINTINQNASQDFGYPSFINIITSQNFKKDPISDPSKIVRILNVYNYQGFNQIMQLPSDFLQEFYCGSSLKNTKCYYAGQDNSSQQKSLTNHIEWAKIVVELPPEADTINDFHFMIPEIFAQASIKNYLYRLETGQFNKETRIFTIEYTSKIFSFDPTTQITALIEKLANQCDKTDIQIVGQAGAQADQISLNIAASSAFSPGASTYGQSALIIVTDWEFWVGGTSTFDQNGNSLFNTVLQPISLRYIDKNAQNRYVIVLLLQGNPTQTGKQVNLYIKIYYLIILIKKQIYFQKVVLPFSYDLPNLLSIVASQDGRLDCYKQYYNSGKDNLYQSELEKLEISIKDNSEGILNTESEITFSPTHKIQQRSQIRVNFVGLKVYTNNCLLNVQLPNKSFLEIPQECSVTTDSQTLIVKITNDEIYDAGLDYKLKFLGTEIIKDVDKSIVLQIRDVSGNVVIQQLRKVVNVNSYSPQSISISKISFSILNLQAYSQLKIEFKTPRSLYDNEILVVNMGSNLNDANTNTDKLSVSLLKDTFSFDIAVKFDSQVIQIIIFDRSSFTPGTYTIQINGVKLPPSSTNDICRVQFLRDYDSNLVITNTYDTTVDFPQFITATNSQIELKNANYLLEGSLQEFSFKVTVQDSQIDGFSKLFIYFPIYYSPALTDMKDHITCKMNKIQTKCLYDPDNPFRLYIQNSPLLVLPKESFELHIFGLVVPQYINRNNPQYKNETIFIAINNNNQDTYSEYVHLIPPQVQRISQNYQYIILKEVKIAKEDTRAKSDHNIIFTSPLSFGPNQGFLIVFPLEYSTLISNPSPTCQISFITNEQNEQKAEKQQCVVNGFSIEGRINIDIPVNTQNIQILIENVPTPPSPGKVDMQFMILQIFDESKQNVITRTNYQTNEVRKIEFQEQSNYLKIESENPDQKYVQITKGTYSNKIFIRTSDLSKFQSNLLIQISGPGFTVTPKDINIFLGDQEQSFVIGVSNEILENFYSLQITKKEYGKKQIYNIVDNMIVFVINVPVNIVMSENIIVPIGGCSLPAKLEIQNTPYQDMEIIYDLKSSFLEMNLELSTFTSIFYTNTSLRYLSLCAFSSSVKEGKYDIDVKLSGENKKSYQLIVKNQAASKITANVIKKDQSIQPDMKIIVNEVKRSWVKLLLQGNTNGVVFWNISVKSNYVSKSLADLKILLKESKTVLQSRKDLFQIFQGDKFDQRIGLEAFDKSNPNPTYIQIDNLIPQTQYVFCYYFSTEFNKITTEICVDFTTLDWDLFTKVTISFTKYAFQDNINDILCYFVSEAQTRIRYIINADGLSCSKNAQPEQYYYQYNGTIYSNAYQATNIYLIPDLQFEVDKSIQALKDVYKKNVVIQDALNRFNIDYIDKSQYSYNFLYATAEQKAEDFAVPKVNSIKFTPKGTTHNSTLIIEDLELSNDGQVFFVADRYSRAVYDPVKDQNYFSPISFVEKPTAQQIIQCKNSMGYNAELCFKAVYNNNNKLKFEVTGLNPKNQYKIYYIVANQFPILPIYAYQSQTRQQKLSQLVQEIQSDTTAGSFPSPLQAVGLFTESMEVSMSLVSDSFPSGRQKLIHSVGNVAQAEFVAEPDTPYTGFFKGADSLLIRLSCAKKPDPTKDAWDNFTPGIGLKYLINGQPSANLVAMFGVNGIPTWNFFGKDKSNHIGSAQGAALKAVAQKFSSATSHIQTVGLRAFAEHDQNGQEVANPKYPWRLIFRAPQNIHDLFSDKYEADYTEQLKRIPNGSTLYDVFAIENPEIGCEKKVGRIVLKSQLNTSKFGDEQLFFQHQKMDFDLDDHPEWTDYTPSWSIWNLIHVPEQTSKKTEGKCPFASLFKY